MNIDISQDVSIALIAAICGIAFPIIIQIIGQIDTKYNSTRLVERIKRSRQYKSFIWLLIITIALRLYYCIAPYWIDNGGFFNFIIGNSAIIITYISLIILLIILFSYILLVIKYYSPNKLLDNLSNDLFIEEKTKHNFAYNSWHNIQKCLNKLSSKKNTDDKNVETPEERNFKDWADLINSIMSSPYSNTFDDSVEEAYSSLWKYVIKYTEKQNDPINNEIVFPLYFYNEILSLNRIICNKTPQLFYRNISNITQMLLGEFMNIRISKESFNCVWLCLEEQLYYNCTEIINDYWKTSYQYYSIIAQPLYEGSLIKVCNKDHIVTNKDVENRKEDRKHFQLFNCMFGALLLYKKQYNLLSFISKYKNSTYEIDSLIPDRYDKILDILFNVNNSNEKPFWLQRFYPFYGINDIYADEQIKSWVETYLAILVIRTEKLYNEDRRNRLNMPEIPNNLLDSKYYDEQISSLSIVIQNVCNSDILEKIDVDFTKKPIAIDKFKEYCDKLKTQYNNIQTNQELNKELVDNFYKSINNSFNEFKAKINKICLNNSIDNKIHFWPLKYDEDRIEEKGVFCTNQDISYSNDNYNSVHSEVLIRNLCLNLSWKMSKLIKIGLDCKEEDLFNVFDKLGISKTDEYIVISNRIGSLILNNTDIKQKDNNNFEYQYGNVIIYNFSNLLMPNKPYVWIIRKENMPTISLGKVPENANMSDQSDGLYVEVFDLNKHEEMQQHYNNAKGTKVLIKIDANIKFHYNNNIEFLGIECKNDYIERIKTDINNIQSIETYI